jgi:hypothetical protein
VVIATKEGVFLKHFKSSLAEAINKEHGKRSRDLVLYADSLKYADVLLDVLIERGFCIDDVRNTIRVFGCEYDICILQNEFASADEINCLFMSAIKIAACSILEHVLTGHHAMTMTNELKGTAIITTGSSRVMLDGREVDLQECDGQTVTYKNTKTKRQSKWVIGRFSGIIPRVTEFDIPWTPKDDDVKSHLFIETSQEPIP